MAADHDTRASDAGAEAESYSASTAQLHAGRHTRAFVCSVPRADAHVPRGLGVDRTCVGIAAPTLMREFGLNKIQMGWAASAFNAAYTFFRSLPDGWPTGTGRE